MYNAVDLYNAIKVAAINAVETSHPCDFLFGKVQSVSPLKVVVEQKMTLTSAQLVLTRNVTNYSVDVSVDGEVHEITIHNGLEIGDGVVLMQKKGGQKYLILDKVVNT